MDNEKLNNEEELETTEEVAEEVTEEVVEVEDAAAEEAVDTEETDAEAENAVADESEAEAVDAEATEETEEVVQKPMNKLVIGIVAAVVAVAAIVAALMAFDVIPNPFKQDENEKVLKIRVVKNNPYEKGFLDTTGEMIGEIADKNGYTIEEYRELFGLPKDLPASTNSNAAQNYIPLRILMKQYGMTMDELKEAYDFGDNVTEETTLGDATGEMTLAAMFGLADLSDEEKSENLTKIKEMYGLGDEVTLETKYKDVRQKIDEYTMNKRIESEEAKKESEKAAQENMQKAKDDDEAALQEAIKKAQDEGRLTGDSEKDSEVIAEILAEQRAAE